MEVVRVGGARRSVHEGEKGEREKGEGEGGRYVRGGGERAGEGEGEAASGMESGERVAGAGGRRGVDSNGVYVESFTGRRGTVVKSVIESVVGIGGASGKGRVGDGCQRHRDDGYDERASPTQAYAFSAQAEGDRDDGRRGQKWDNEAETGIRRGRVGRATVVRPRLCER